MFDRPRAGRCLRGAARALRVRAGAVSIGVAIAAGFGGLLLMLMVDMREVVAARPDTHSTAPAVTTPMEKDRWI